MLAQYVFATINSTILLQCGYESHIQIDLREGTRAFKELQWAETKSRILHA